ncbi:MAG: patatin-like phospholipase family protein [Alphaproteobacteria bacterium]|jgi:predicted acylesterase/phospholipase RssA|nr:patatin-like phospholipase family protein [Alphaproteobacteria bacterium]
MKRAIVLAGGGPAIGLSIGALKRLEEESDITFDIASTACIGAWLAATYYQAPKSERLATTERFFRKVFRPETVYSRFPIAACFAPNISKMIHNTAAFALNPDTYRNLVVPEIIRDATEDLLRFASDPRQWTEANANTLMLNSVLAANPLTRFFTSMAFLTKHTGLAQIFYPDSPLLDQIDFNALSGPDTPIIYHNAFNLTHNRMDLFCNKPELGLPPISGQSLCGGSALPFLADKVEIDGQVFCEGATVEPVNFRGLLENHPDLDEIWVSRILDRSQIREPENLYEALNNLVTILAASKSQDNVTLFKHELERSGRNVKLIEIPVASDIEYHWTHENLDRGIELGYAATSQTIAEYRADIRRAEEEPHRSPRLALVKSGDIETAAPTPIPHPIAGPLLPARAASGRPGQARSVPAHAAPGHTAPARSIPPLPQPAALPPRRAVSGARGAGRGPLRRVTRPVRRTGRLSRHVA